jgi:hypothetical protein
MSTNPTDMTGRSARDAGESRTTQDVRRRTLEGDAPPSAEEIGKAVAQAMQRSISAPPASQKIGEIVRVSVRCGYETEAQVSSDGSRRLVTKPGSVLFRAEDTPDGRPVRVEHGRPARLTRAGYEHWNAQGKVLIAE